MKMRCPAVLLKNEATGRFHPMIYRRAPLPSADQYAVIQRYKSIGHHTDGFDSRDAALEHIRGQKEHGWVWTGHELSWTGQDVPASVTFFDESKLLEML